VIQYKVWLNRVDNSSWKVVKRMTVDPDSDISMSVDKMSKVAEKKSPDKVLINSEKEKPVRMDNKMEKKFNGHLVKELTTQMVQPEGHQSLPEQLEDLKEQVLELKATLIWDGPK
jgi:hypothetical protein